jgi:chromosome segregation ATPase
MADINSEILALLAESMRAADRDREENMRRFERLTEVMVDGFGRLEGKIGETNTRLDHLTERVDHLTERVDHLTERVDHLTVEVAELKTDMREVKADVREIKVQAQETNRRLANVFEHTGQLTEATQASELRLSHVEQAQHPTNAELDARLRAVEAQLRSAS